MKPAVCSKCGRELGGMVPDDAADVVCFKCDNLEEVTVIGVTLLHSVPLELVGFIPEMLSESDPRPAREQLDANYKHGGGWQPFHGHTLVPEEGFTLCYPGDPPMHPIALIRLRRERVVIYPHAWVVILQEDNTFEVARMD